MWFQKSKSSNAGNGNSSPDSKNSRMTQGNNNIDVRSNSVFSMDYVKQIMKKTESRMNIDRVEMLCNCVAVASILLNNIIMLFLIRYLPDFIMTS